MSEKPSPDKVSGFAWNIMRERPHDPPVQTDLRAWAQRYVWGATDHECGGLHPGSCRHCDGNAEQLIKEMQPFILAARAEGRAEMRVVDAAVDDDEIGPLCESCNEPATRKTTDDVDMCAECYQILCEEQGVTGETETPK